MFNKVPYIEQMEHSECGLACLAMILGFNGHQVSLSSLREENGVPKGGFSIFQLKEIANDYALECKAFKSCAKDLVSSFTGDPIIVFWEHKHFIILEEIKKNHIKVIDPALGRRKISHDEFSEKYSGVFLSFKPEEAFRKVRLPNYLMFLVRYVKNSPKLIVAVVLFSLLIQVFALSLPLITRWVTDEILIQTNIEKLSEVGSLLLLILVGFAIISGLRGLFIAKLQTLLDRNMMTHFVDHLLQLPYGFFENRANGDLLFSANSYVYIRQILSTRMISLFIDGLLLFTYAALMLNMARDLGIIVILVGLSLFTMLLLSTRITHNITNADVTNQSKVQKLLTESITGITDIKVMGLEKKFYSDWLSNFNRQLRSSEKRSIWTVLLNIPSSTVQFVLPLSVLFIGGYSLIEGQISLGTLVAFSTMALSFINPITTIGLAYSEIVSLKSYIQRIHDVIETEVEEYNPEKESELKRLKGNIEINNLSFRYNKYSKDILKNIDLTIDSGETVAIVGKSGSGKSTLAKLLLQLYTPTEGEIKFDGVSANEFSKKQLRSQFGSVLQETVLFNKSILENIILEKEGISEERLLSACHRADILDDILTSPIGFETIVSEQGTNFSGGQRQRLILARAFVKEPSILILDEATSALDNLSEKRIDKNISELNSTRIIIAHRLSTIKNANKIVVLDDGAIIETGTHKELYSKKGFYYDLYNASETNKNLEKLLV